MCWSVVGDESRGAIVGFESFVELTSGLENVPEFVVELPISRREFQSLPIGENRSIEFPSDDISIPNLFAIASG